MWRPRPLVTFNVDLRDRDNDPRMWRDSYRREKMAAKQQEEDAKEAEQIQAEMHKIAGRDGIEAANAYGNRAFKAHGLDQRGLQTPKLKASEGLGTMGLAEMTDYAGNKVLVDPQGDNRRRARSQSVAFASRAGLDPSMSGAQTPTGMLPPEAFADPDMAMLAGDMRADMRPAAPPTEVSDEELDYLINGPRVGGMPADLHAREQALFAASEGMPDDLRMREEMLLSEVPGGVGGRKSPDLMAAARVGGFMRPAGEIDSVGPGGMAPVPGMRGHAAAPVEAMAGRTNAFYGDDMLAADAVPARQVPAEADPQLMGELDAVLRGERPASESRPNNPIVDEYMAAVQRGDDATVKLLQGGLKTIEKKEIEAQKAAARADQQDAKDSAAMARLREKLAAKEKKYTKGGTRGLGRKALTDLLKDTTREGSTLSSELRGVENEINEIDIHITKGKVIDGAQVLPSGAELQRLEARKAALEGRKTSLVKRVADVKHHHDRYQMMMEGLPAPPRQRPEKGGKKGKPAPEEESYGIVDTLRGAASLFGGGGGEAAPAAKSAATVQVKNPTTGEVKTILKSKLDVALKRGWVKG